LSYNNLEKFLHKIALNNDLVNEILFSVEKVFFNTEKKSKNIFICGLARSGSTLLLEILHENKVFASLTYNDMPFILSTNLWAAITRYFKKDTIKKLRAHDDQIFFDNNSAEAFEEVFWRIKLNSKYIKKNYLKENIYDTDQLNNFRFFISLILNRYNKKFYISKNNNNVLRIKSLIKDFTDSYFIVPFRSPLKQSYSLLNQHLKFTEKQIEDKFVLEYMNYISHHEFGLNHKPFFFDKKKENNLDQTNINYWLSCWIDTHKYLLNEIPNNKKVFFVCYEELDKNINSILKYFSNELDTKLYNNKKIIYPEENKINLSECDKKLKDEAEKIYLKLTQKSFRGR
jgi:hypothetical protein